MRILSAQLIDFRNVATANLRFSPRLTALIGPNGQGKTNVLEALYGVAALRPLRNIPRSELVRAGTSRARVELEVEEASTGLVRALAVELRSSGRVLLKDGKRAEPARFLGHLVVVAFTPDDLELSKGPPEGRRRFLDRAILNLRPTYLDTALRYRRALKARARILAEDGPDALLDAYDAVLAQEGGTILVERARYAEALAPAITAAFDRVAHPAPAVTAAYRSTALDGVDVESVEATREALATALRERRGRDRRRRTTTVGPHLDDLDLRLGGAPLRLWASQGQHRALVLALKLAEIGHLTARLGEPPVLLLDDISSELDQARSRQLFDAMAALDCQAVLTTTDEAQVMAGSLGRFGPIAIYDVSEGTLVPRAAS